MDASVPENLAASLVKQNIDVLVDENNDSLIYQLAVVDEANNAHLVLPYEDTQKHLQSKAEDNAKNPFIWLAGLVLTLLGIFALWLKRKRRQIQAMT